MYRRGVSYNDVYGITTELEKTPLGQRPLSFYADPNDPHAGPAAHAGIPPPVVAHRPAYMDHAYPGHISGAMGAMYRAQAAAQQAAAQQPVPQGAPGQPGSLFGLLVLSLLLVLGGLAVAELVSQRKTRQAIMELQIQLLTKGLRL